MEVTDYTLAILRVTPSNYATLGYKKHEMLRLYAVRSWTEDDILCFEVANYRVGEILGMEEER